MITSHVNLISIGTSRTNYFKIIVKYKSFCRFLKAEITRFTCHATNSVSCGSTMLLKMALKKKTGKLRRLQPNNQSFLSKDLQHIKSGTGEHDTEIFMFLHLKLLICNVVLSLNLDHLSFLAFKGTQSKHRSLYFSTNVAFIEWRPL